MVYGQFEAPVVIRISPAGPALEYNGSRRYSLLVVAVGYFSGNRDGLGGEAAQEEKRKQILLT